jgi:hypothetical protein
MITQSHIETVLGAALSNLGHPIGNAAFWQEHIKGTSLTEKQIFDECERLLKEQKGIPTTMDSVRRKRNELLKESDWVGLTDVNIPNKQAWLDYRQSLRDLPQTFSKPEEVVWANKPE